MRDTELVLKLLRSRFSPQALVLSASARLNGLWQERAPVELLDKLHFPNF